MRADLIGDVDSRSCLFTRRQQTPDAPTRFDQKVHEGTQQQPGAPSLARVTLDQQAKTGKSWVQIHPECIRPSNI